MQNSFCPSANAPLSFARATVKFLSRCDWMSLPGVRHVSSIDAEGDMLWTSMFLAAPLLQYAVLSACIPLTPVLLLSWQQPEGAVTSSAALLVCCRFAASRSRF